MIRVVTLDAYDAEAASTEALQDALHGVRRGLRARRATCALPGGAERAVRRRQALLEALPASRAYADDKILYLTSRKLKDRARSSPGTRRPGLRALRQGPRALVSSAGVKDLEASLKLVGAARDAPARAPVGAAPLPRPALRDVPALDARPSTPATPSSAPSAATRASRRSALPSPERRPSAHGAGTRVRLDRANEPRDDGSIEVNRGASRERGGRRTKRSAWCQRPARSRSALCPTRSESPGSPPGRGSALHPGVRACGRPARRGRGQSPGAEGRRAHRCTRNNLEQE